MKHVKLFLLFVSFCLATLSSALATVIVDGFTVASNWGTLVTGSGANMAFGSGRVNYTSSTTANTGAGILRNSPLLSPTEDWSLRVDVHLDAFALNTDGQFSDVFLGVGKTGDEMNTHLVLEFGRGRWGGSGGYYIGDDILINDMDVDDVFSEEDLNITAAESALRMDYSAATHMFTYYFDIDGPTGGYNWVVKGSASLADAINEYGLVMGASDTFTILLMGSSEHQTVGTGQAYWRNLVITTGAAAPTAPSIIQQPTSAANVPGSTATFSVAATGTAPLAYQWRFNGTNLGNGGNVSGATTNLLTITNLQYNHAGDYSVVVANTYGSVTSSVAVLVVTEPVPFTYTTDGGTITITDYTGSGGYVVIPSTIDGLPVTAIGYCAFDHCTGLTEVVIPDSVTNIGWSAFLGCTGLTNVVIGSGVTTIGDYAFYGCEGLTDLLIPDSVTSIGDCAFAEWTGLTEVEIPDSVTTIGDLAFGYCPSLTNIAVAAENPSYTSLDGVLFNKELTTLVQFPGGLVGSYVIPDSVTTIGDYAFSYCSSLTDLLIPDSVTTIGDWVFENCTGLTEVVIPDSVTTIGDAAFEGCTGLTNIVVAVENQSYASLDGVLFNKDLTTLAQFPRGLAGFYVIPDSVTTIGNWAFCECTSLTEVAIPDSVTTIGDYAFWGCTALTNVVIGSGVTTIGGSAFWGCYGLTNVVIPDSVTNIGWSAFLGCTGLTNVVIGSGVTTIGGSAFYECSGLTEVVIGSGVTTIGGSAFYECSGLTEVVIGSGVTTIGDFAFANCSSLNEVYFLGNKPTTVEFYVFYGVTAGTVYYLTGTTGWGSTFGGWPTMAFIPEPVIVDQDSDGLPDDWETEHFGGTFLQGAGDDYDNDLLDNISEWIAGTDPSDPNSVFEVSVSTNQVPIGFVIGWTSIEDRTYSVRWRGSLTNAYQLLQNGIEYPQDSYTDTLHHAESTGFYQIEVSTNTPPGDTPPEGMVLIPAGTNSGTDPDIGAYSLTVTKAFYMDATEVTKAQWDTVYNWAVANGYNFDNVGSGKAPNHPVHTVSWYDVVKWCNARSEMEGRTPCYTVNGIPYKTGQSAPVCNFEADGYRLPTSTEWEYAARGGLQGKRFPWGDTITHSQANYSSDSYYSYDTSATRDWHPDYDEGGYPYTSPVGSFSANGYGLYDMSGNVWEWCWDASGSGRDFRGGSWYGNAFVARCGFAFWSYPGGAFSTGGFRAVCR